MYRYGSRARARARATKRRRDFPNAFGEFATLPEIPDIGLQETPESQDLAASLLLLFYVAVEYWRGE